MSINNPELRRIAWLLAGLSVLYVVFWLSPLLHFLDGVHVMSLPMHIAMESFAIVVAMLVFGIAWNAYGAERPGNILILACGFLTVGLLDFAHMLSFKGMPDFVTPGNPEKGIQFWLVARFIAALTLLTVALRPWEPLAKPRTRYWLLGGGLAITAIVYWLGLYHEQAWPHTFIEGQGLTPLKVEAELVIVLIMLVSAVLFYRQARLNHLRKLNPDSLFAASSITILSELCFILYSDVNDIFNLLGHVYKVIAYVFIYRAVFVGSVREPFLKLQEAKEELGASRMMLRSIIDNVPVRIFWKDRAGRYLGANGLFLRDAGLEDERQLIGKRDVELFPSHAELYGSDDRNVMETATPKLDFEEPIQTADGRTAYLITSKVPLREPGGGVLGVLGTYVDITERKLVENRLTMMNFALNQTHESVYLFDQNTLQFIYVNDQACRALGYSREELLGMRIFDIDPDATPEEMVDIRKRKVARGSIVLERRHRTKDGAIFPVEIHSSNFEFEGMQISFSFARDITERRRMEAREAVRLQIFEQMAQGGELLDILGQVVKYIELGLPGYVAGVMLADAGGRHLRPAVMPTLPGAQLAAGNIEIGDGATPCGMAARQRETIIVQDLPARDLEGPCRHFVTQAGVLSCWSEPIFDSAGEVLGTFCIYRAEPGTPSEDDLQLVRRASHFAAIAIERKRAEQLLDESYAQLRGMAAQREAAREEERKRIAREVHDELGQILTGLQLNVSVLQHKLAAASLPLDEHLKDTMALTDKALGVARNVASALRPAALDMGIVSALEWLAQRFGANTGIRCEVLIADNEIQLDENQAIALFRIVQESLTNVARYAQADEVDISLQREGDDYVLKVRDNGNGFDTKVKKQNSFGLVGIRERALMLGGELVIHSQPGEGTEIEVRVPACIISGEV